MNNNSKKKACNNPRILMFSQRNIYDNMPSRCPFYEFEDIVCQIDSVENLAPQPNKWFKRGTRIANRMAKSSTIALNPGIPKIKIKKYYDLFFTACSFPRDLLNVNVVEGWKDYCKTSICWLDEIWLNEMSRFQCFLKILSEFDYVFLYYSQSVDAVHQATRSKCFYLPPAVNAIIFCPYPKSPERFIDVYSMGRRSEVTHQTLLRMAKEDKIFYVYDSILGNRVANPEQHRFLFANMAKRTRYFIVNPGLVDAPHITGGQSETGYRFFEGAASGTIMIGEHPKNDEFLKIFHWPDAVIQLSYDSDNIDKIINELDKQPQRQKQIRRNNVVESLRKHDWVYRWETVLNTAGLEPMSGVIERKKRLKNLSEMIEKE